MEILLKKETVLQKLARLGPPGQNGLEVARKINARKIASENCLLMDMMKNYQYLRARG